MACAVLGRLILARGYVTKKRWFNKHGHALGKKHGLIRGEIDRNPLLLAKIGHFDVN